MPLPVIVILGAPNVGKSTLFNRLVGRNQAIVTDEPGVTRDRLLGLVRRAARPFQLVDTGGWTGDKEAPLAKDIERQSEAALAGATGVLLVVDARAGATAIDRDLATKLRRRALPAVLVANKVDVPSHESFTHELFELGLGDPIAVSAEHGLGLDELLAGIEHVIGEKDAVLRSSEPAAKDESPPIRVAIVGRPNVGKSSLLNRLLGEERLLVSEIPGTTRDAVDTLIERDGRRYRMVDTAGMRRPGRVRAGAETFAVERARQSVRRADVVVLVLDAVEGFGAQDAHIAGYAVAAKKPMVVVVNKWDLVTDREGAAQAWEEVLRQRLRFLKQPPLLLASAKTSQRVSKILDRVVEVHATSGIRVPTPQLNRWLGEQATAERSARAGGRSIRLLYATQTGIHPPRFVLFCNDAKRVHFSLRRRLENSLRERFGFGASPIHLQFRSRRDYRRR